MKEKVFKKGFKKRLFSVVLALAMVFSLMPMNSLVAYAAGTAYTYTNVFYDNGDWKESGGQNVLQIGDTFGAGCNRGGFSDAELYAYSLDLKGSMGDSIGGTVVKIAGNKLYLCSNHNGSSSSACIRCGIACASGTAYTYTNVFYSDGDWKESGGQNVLQVGDTFGTGCNRGGYSDAELYVYSLDLKGSMGDSIGGTVVKIAGNKLYLCSNHSSVGGAACATCGISDHSHTWVYSLENNNTTIKATCTPVGGGTCPDSKTATLTLSASDANYSGSAVEATMDKTAWEAAGLTAPSIVYEAKTGSSLTNDKAINVGSYTAKITVDNKEASVDFAINAKAITPTIADITAVTYDGSVKKPALTVTGDSKTLVKDTDYTVSYSNNTNAGTATASVTLQGNYSGTASKEFTINKATPVAGTQYTVPTGLTAKIGKTLANITLPENFTWVEAGTTSVGSSVGNLTFHVKYTSPDNNYSDVESIEVTVAVVAKYTQTITAENITVNFGDTDKKVTAATDGNGTLSYEIKSGANEDVVEVNPSTGTLTTLKAGTTTIVITAAETTDYASDSKEVTVTVKPAIIHKDAGDFVVSATTPSKEFTIGSTSASTIHIDGLTPNDVKVDDEFKGVLVMNGETELIYNTDYTITEGSVKVNLTKSYLDTLPVGTHNIKVYVKQNGEAKVEDNDVVLNVNVVIKVKPSTGGGISAPTTTPTYKVPNTSAGQQNNSITKTIGLLAIATVAGYVVKKKED